MSCAVGHNTAQILCCRGWGRDGRLQFNPKPGNLHVPWGAAKKTKKKKKKFTWKDFFCDKRCMSMQFL